MRTPTVHLNGSSADVLIEQYRNAARAIREALEALQLAAPHGRDFYVQEGEAIKEATAEHAARVTKLQSVLAEITQMHEAVYAQKKRA